MPWPATVLPAHPYYMLRPANCKEDSDPGNRKAMQWAMSSCRLIPGRNFFATIAPSCSVSSHKRSYSLEMLCCKRPCGSISNLSEWFAQVRLARGQIHMTACDTESSSRKVAEAQALLSNPRLLRPVVYSSCCQAQHSEPWNIQSNTLPPLHPKKGDLRNVHVPVHACVCVHN